MTVNLPNLTDIERTGLEHRQPQQRQEVAPPIVQHSSRPASQPGGWPYERSNT
ncbi:hypothetical protein [Streptomyces misionensis]|uniref:hypothetical protein n=1 Tax=Streptomyces misionensis TaxID=67331 RepID=UPI0033BD672C